MLTFSDGTVLVVTMFGETVKEFTLGRDAHETGMCSSALCRSAFPTGTRREVHMRNQVCYALGFGLVGCIDRKTRSRWPSKVVLLLK